MNAAKILLAIKILFFLCLALLSNPLNGQASFQGIGDLPGGAVFSWAKGISADGKVIVGGSDGANGGEAFYWHVDQATMVGIGDLPGDAFYSIANATSTDGSVIVGTSVSADGERAFRWQAGTMTDLGIVPTANWSRAYGVSGDGNTIVGISSEFAFVYSGGSMSAIPNPWDPEPEDGANGVSSDGTHIVGYADNTDNQSEAFLYTSAGGMIGLGMPRGEAFSITPDNKIVVGRTMNQGFRWTSTDGMTLIGGSAAQDISADGKRIVGYGSEAILWEDSTMHVLKTLLEDTHGLDLTGWTLSRANAISDDGRVIAGYGTNPDGNLEAWRAVLPGDFTLNAPQAGVRWTVDKIDTIRWNGPSDKFYNIDLSLDDGNTWELIDFTTNPGDTMITYWVADTIRTTDKARIRILDLLDSTVYAISEKFTIKGYDLTRVMPDGSLQNFDIMKHSWQMGNAAANMWPMSWWQQYNYAGGIDPITGESYPSDWPLAPLNARAVNFPAWPTFVAAFSENQAYWSVFFASYKESATEYWRARKGTWGGSCFGFSYTSLLAFDHPTDFLSANPGIAQVDSIHALFLNNTIRRAINREFAKQYAGEVLANDVIGKLKSPRTLLQETKDLFLDETQDARPLTFFNNNASGAHTVVPYLLERDSVQTGLWRLFVYDNSNPNQLNRFILIDSTNNLWTDNIFNSWGTGSTRCYLELPSGNFLQTLTMGPLSTLENEPMLQLYSGVENEVLIRNTAGETIGYQDSSDFNTMSNGIAIIPKTGSFSPPIGYYLPANEYAATLSEFSNTDAVFSTVSGDMIYRYSRSDADFSQQDHIYAGNGLQITNEDAASKEITLTAIVTQDSSERKISASELAIVESDSLDFKLLPGDQLQLANFGVAKTYQLQISAASASKVDSFNHNLISIAANSTHQIAANWDDLNEPVIIYIDLDNDGSIDDSTLVANQPVGIDETVQVAEIPEQFELLQNYPNPFNPTTQIGFRIPPGGRSEFGMVDLTIYDITGRLVKTLVNENRAAGNYSVQWDGTNQFGQQVGSGVYFYRLETVGYTATRKMLLVR